MTLTLSHSSPTLSLHPLLRCIVCLLSLRLAEGTEGRVGFVCAQCAGVHRMGPSPRIQSCYNDAWKPETVEVALVCMRTLMIWLLGMVVWGWGGEHSIDADADVFLLPKTRGCPNMTSAVHVYFLIFLARHG